MDRLPQTRPLAMMSAIAISQQWPANDHRMRPKRLSCGAPNSKDLASYFVRVRLWLDCSSGGDVQCYEAQWEHATGRAAGCQLLWQRQSLDSSMVVWRHSYLPARR